MLIYYLRTHSSVYEDFYRDKDLFDFIDYPKDSKFFDPANKKLLEK